MSKHRWLSHAVVIVAAVMISSAPPSAAAQKEWTWIDRDCKTRTLTELQQILTEHRKFVLTGEGAPADLAGAILRDAPLDKVLLIEANLKKADLRRAHLSHAQLGKADLRETSLEGADLTGALLNLSRLNKANLGPESVILGGCTQTKPSSEGKRVGAAHPNISRNLAVMVKLLQTGIPETNGPAKMAGASLVEADLTDANLSSVDLTHADLTLAILHHADLSSATIVASNLTSADLTDSKSLSAQASRAIFKLTNLKGANLRAADLTQAKIMATELGGADLDNARLWGAVFEPRSLREPSLVATANGLDFVTYSASPAALSNLRAQFQNGGFRDQERQVTYALRRTDASIHRSNCRVPTAFHDCAAYAFNTFFFDWTSLYGKHPGRPLLILAVVGSIMAVVYFLSMHFGRRAGIWLVKSGINGRQTRKVRVLIRPMPASRSYWSRMKLLLRTEWRLARAAMFFSLISAFNIGYQELNIGQWLGMLTNREYQLKAAGWTRTAAGFQSLVSVFLLALWVLTYFGHPFAQ